jgi:hypothetical protein
MGRNTWQNLIFDDPRGLSADGLTLASFTTSAPVFPPLVLPANFMKTGQGHQREGPRDLGGDGDADVHVPAAVHRRHRRDVVTSAAITVSAITNQAWEIDIDVQCRSEGTSGTVEGMGDLNLGGVTGTQYLPATGSAPATATVDTTIAQTLGLEIACSASSASNTVKGILLKVKAEN